MTIARAAGRTHRRWAIALVMTGLGGASACVGATVAEGPPVGGNDAAIPLADSATSDGPLATDAALRDGNLVDALESGATDAPPDAVVDSGSLVLCGATNTLAGLPVTLQNATATFSQTAFAQFTIGKAIDGLTNDQLGWGISPGGGVGTAQTAAFETATDTPAFAQGTRFVVVLTHAYPTEHALGRFRISATTSPRTNFADGNEGTTTPGDVGASGIWSVLTPTVFCATNGATMTVQGDSSILVADMNSTVVSYVVELETVLTGITGLRLEVLKDASLPQSGPGLQDSNGNFCLSELTVRAAAK